MEAIAFFKLIPGGNPTVLVSGAAAGRRFLPDLASALMDDLHLQAEQVGYLDWPSRSEGSMPHLQMMGGEFCVNAARAAAFILARRGFLTYDPAHCFWSGDLCVSGADSPVAVYVAQDRSFLLNWMGWSGQFERLKELHPSGHDLSRQPCCLPSMAYASVHLDFSDSLLDICLLEPGAVVVHLPGISHVLLDTALHVLPDDPLQGSGFWRQKAGLASVPASGVVWYERRGQLCRIWPVVRVCATGSEYLESACGSASLAVAIFFHRTFLKETKKHFSSFCASLSVMQPSRELLDVHIAGAAPGDSFKPSVFVGGPVKLAAQGVAYV